MAIKPEILQSILSDADTAKSVKNMKHSYSPEEYNKLMARNRAMGLINDTSNGGMYEANIKEGDVEFDMNGNLRKIKRTQPMLLDLNRYTANRYMVEKVGLPAKGERRILTPGTYILCVFGEAIVQAISANNELPKTVKAFRFFKDTETTITNIPVADEQGNPVLDENGQPKTEEKKETKTVWKYVRSEFIKNELVYTMTGHLNIDAALSLIQQVEELADSADDRLEGDSLDDIA